MNSTLSTEYDLLFNTFKSSIKKIQKNFDLNFFEINPILKKQIENIFQTPESKLFDKIFFI